MPEIKSGRYRHYRGGEYRFLGVALQTETREELAVYESLKEGERGRLFARPKEMFRDKVEVDGIVKDRFEFLGGETD